MTGESMARRQQVEILMVEDSPSDAALAKEAFKNGKIANKLTVVENGVKAIDYLLKRNGFESAVTPDLILLDLNLPIKSGFEVLAEIKKDDKLRRIPVIVLTTSMEERDVLKSYDLQASCFITKPVEFDNFVSAVQSLRQFWFKVVTLPDNGDE